MNNVQKKIYNKQELENLLYKIFSKEEKLREDGVVLLFLEMELCSYVKALIEEKHKSLKKLSFLDSEKTVTTWNGKHSGGCTYCLSEGLNPLRISTSCQLSCPFCYEYEKYTIPLAKNQVIFQGNLFSPSSFKVLIEKYTSESLFKSISWASRGEPLLEMEKIEEMMPFLNKLGLYQWIYTNGILATDKNLKKLQDFGLDEIRFDLQATKFDEKIIENMENATKYIKKVVVETPMYSESYQNFIKHIKNLSSITKFYNIPELQVFPTNIYNFLGTEGIMYKHNRGYTSPISSILYIYEFLEYLEKNNYDITINVCSNATKYYRGCSTRFPGTVFYNSYIEHLPMDSYIFIINEYFKSGREYWEVF